MESKLIELGSHCVARLRDFRHRPGLKDKSEAIFLQFFQEADHNQLTQEINISGRDCLKRLADSIYEAIR